MQNQDKTADVLREELSKLFSMENIELKQVHLLFSCSGATVQWVNRHISQRLFIQGIWTSSTEPAFDNTSLDAFVNHCSP